MSIAARLRRLFVYTPPDPIGFWSGRAKDAGWLSVMWQNPAYNELAHRDQWAAIERHLPSRRDSVLDLGCGTGRLSDQLGVLFAEYTGVDLEPMVAEAARRNPDLRAQYVASSVQDYAFPSASFDLVLSMACLASACRADEIPAIAERIVRATRPGGRIILIEPFHYVPALVRTCRLRPADVVAEFARAGAARVAWSGIHFVPVRLAFARESAARFGRLTRLAYGIGEVVLGVWPRALSDYKVLVFERSVSDHKE